MKISVVIPCHNCAPWLGEALQSVYSQEYQPFEVIVVDDASQDGSLDVVRAHAPDALVLSVDYHNAAAARNHAVAQARGDWIAFLDADDAWYSDHLRRSVGVLERSSDVASLSHYREYYPDSGEWVEKKPVDLVGRLSGLTDQDTYCIYTAKNNNNGWPTVGMVVERVRFVEIGGFDVRLIIRHDADMFVRLVHNRTWSYIPDVTWFYRKRSVGAISSDRPECIYYAFRSLLKASKLLPGREMQQTVARHARIAMGSAMRSGEEDLIRRTLSVAGPYLSKRWRLFAEANRLARGGGRRVLAMKDKLRITK